MSKRIKDGELTIKEKKSLDFLNPLCHSCRTRMPVQFEEAS